MAQDWIVLEAWVKKILLKRSGTFISLPIKKVLLIGFDNTKVEIQHVLKTQ